MTTPPDVLRVFAVPFFAWIALVDYRTRRVPGWTWYPLVVIAVVALAWEAAIASSGVLRWQRFIVAVALSIGVLIPLGYGFYRFGGFGRADAKAFVVVAILFPTFPLFRIGSVVLPVSVPAIAVFSLTIVTDAVIVGALYPVGIAVWNAYHRRLSPAMFLGYPVHWARLPEVHGRLMEDEDGFRLSGVDLDTLRMYLRWRGISLGDLRDRPDELSDPETLPDQPNQPTDGAVEARPDGGDIHYPPDSDRWGAAAFLADVDRAYGATPAQLRAGLDVIVSKDAVWVSPGIPFLVPLFLGMIVAFTYGDVLFAILRFSGIV